MRRRILQLICLFAGLLLVVVLSPSSRPVPEPRLPDAQGRQPFTVLQQALTRADAKARWDSAVWYGMAASTPAKVSLPPKRVIRPTRVVYGTGACGGDLPPCSVMMCESGGNLTAQNRHSTASGKWQILDSTWNGFGGYSRAMYAPESVQDDKARELYAGGAGRSQWVC